MSNSVQADNGLEEDASANSVPGEKINKLVGKYDSITVYEVSDSELTVLEKGSGASVYLNWGIFFLGVVLTSIPNLFLIDRSSYGVCFSVMLFICICSGFAALIMLVLYRSTSNEYKDTLMKIKNRVK